MRKICFYTGSRADYGLLKPLLDAVKNDSDIKLQLLVSGMHLSHEFGLTFTEIEKNGFEIDEKIEVLVSSDTDVGISKSIGLGLISYSEAFQRLSPDIIVILGDRFEAFSAATAALILNIPIAHIHGGEITLGAIDDSLRHCITKMSSLHFTATQEYGKRVVQMGEQPEHVYHVGAIGLDNINNINMLNKKAFEKSIDFKLGKRNLLITYHPETKEPKLLEKNFNNLLNVLASLVETRLIFTKANADAGGRAINEMIDWFVESHKEKAIAFTSLGQQRYLSALKFVDGVIGNSSSGIIEVPSFHVGTVNIGNRQKGRIMPDSVINCSTRMESIEKAILKLYSLEFQQKVKNTVSPYDNGGASQRIVNVLKNIEINQISNKKFYDIDH